MAKPKKAPDEEAEEKDGAEGAEGGAAAEGTEGGDGKKSKKKLIIMAVGALVLIGGGVCGAYYMGMFSKHAEQSDVELGPDGKPIEKAIFYTLPEFLVNLNSSSKQSSFLKATVIVEVAHQSDVPQIEANLPRLQDTLNTYLRELRPSDLTGSAGIQRLREELLLRANKTLAPVKINDVLFKEIIVQ